MSSQAKSDAFAEAARNVFASWTVLNLAVDNQWGGPMAKEKSIEMFDYTVRLFKESSRVYPDELESYFENYFSDEFSTEAGDGSPKQVANLLIEVHKECMLGNMDRVSALVGTQTVSSVSESRRDNESDDEVSGEEEDEEMGDAPPPPPQQHPNAPRRVVDDDGWETVTRKGRR